MPRTNTLRDVLVQEIKRLHNAEIQLVYALPRFIEQMAESGLKACLEVQFWEAHRHLGRLEEIAKSLGTTVRGCVSVGMTDILAEMQAQLGIASEQLLDTALGAAAHKIAHYKIAGYANAEAIAKELQLEPEAEMLRLTREEEAAAGEKLESLARHSAKGSLQSVATG